MGANRIFSVLFILSTLLGLSVGSAFAQNADDDVVNYVFTTDAEWLEQSQLKAFESDVNVRSIPTDESNTPLFSTDPGWFVEIVATHEGWYLGSFWDSTGTYRGHGWFSEEVSTMKDPVGTPQLKTPDCVLDSEGQQIFVMVRYNSGWVHDTRSTNCTLFYEGRREEVDRHDYWVVVDNDGTGEPNVVKSDEYLENGYMWLLEGTGWIHPTTWNVGSGFEEGYTGADMQYPPMIFYFAMDKQQVMRDNSYAWPIRINMQSGEHFDYEFGAFGETPNTVDRCTELHVQNVTGIFIPAKNNIPAHFRSTSVGAIDCTSLFLWKLLDGSWQLFAFEGNLERLEYRQVKFAYLLPSSMTEEEIADFALATLSEAGLEAGTIVNTVGVPGIPDGPLQFDE